MHLHSTELLSCISESCHAQVSAAATAAPSTLQPEMMRFLRQWPFTIQNLPMDSHAVRIALFRQRSSSRLLPFHVKTSP